MALSTKPVVPEDNVESVDMEMSSEEELESSTPETTKTSTSVSFSLSSAAKPLPESPLIEKEEPKTAALPRLDTDTPPPETTVLEPPPLPSADMFPEVENSDEGQKEINPPDPETPVVVKDSPLSVPVLQSNPQSAIPPLPRFVGPSRPRLPMNRPRYSQWRGNMRGQHVLPPPPPPPLLPLQNMRGPPFGGPRFRPPFDSQAFRGRPLFRGQRWPQRFNSW